MVLATFVMSPLALYWHISQAKAELAGLAMIDAKLWLNIHGGSSVSISLRIKLENSLLTYGC
jgi:hypothetical protein